MAIENILPPSAASTYLASGKGKFTLVGKDSRYTFQENSSDDKKLIFIKLLVGSNNEADYQYIGYMKEEGSEFKLNAGKKGNANHPAYKALNWYINCLKRAPEKASQATFYHEGRCGRCGRTLTTPESIKAGFGPECIKHI